MLTWKTLGACIILGVIIGVGAGYFFLLHTSFSLTSIRMVDDHGFPGVQLRFNVSNTVTIAFRKSTGSVLSHEEVYKNGKTTLLHFGLYQHTPEPESYQIRVADKQGGTVFTKTFIYQGGSLLVTKVSPSWSTDPDNTKMFALVGLEMNVMNQGDLPVYPETALLSFAGKQADVRVLPTVVLPGKNTTLSCFVYLDKISADTTTLEITLIDAQGRIGSTTQMVSPSVNSVSNEHSWDYNGNHQLTIPNPGCLIGYYKNITRYLTEDYAVYTFDQYDTYYLEVVAQRLTQAFGEKTNQISVNAVASFVQNIPYALDDPDNASVEYPRFPVETMVDQQGDCEDKAILLASLLDTLGYNVSLLRLPDHMAVGVHLDELPGFSPYIDGYFYLESTKPNWLLGQIPPEYKNPVNVTVYQLSERPHLLHNWRNATRFSGQDGTDFVKIRVMIQNIGSKDADAVELRGAFFSSDGYIFNQETSTIPLVSQGGAVLVDLEIKVPMNTKTLLKTQIFFNDKLVDEKESASWFS